MTRYIIIVTILSTLTFISCQDEQSTTQPQQDQLPFEKPPTWAEQAIWYQIFVERFRNGDQTNDPILESVKGSWIEPYSDNWQPTDWGQNWYAQESWAKEADLEFYSSVQMRRYGGDIQGVMDKIDHFKALGITAIYFNPINDAPSLHKFDARTYRHVDIHFGPDPLGDKKIIEEEDPTDITTWKLTSADKLFFELVSKLHKEEIKVIVDFSWNHTGSTFWAFEDVKKNQAKSKYKDWYEIKSFDDPETEENEFEYEGWLGISTLPDLKKTRLTEKVPGHPYEGNMKAEPKQHVFNVTKKYMDPNGDGDTSDGIDGMRLDVAEHVPLGFWRDFRKYVRSINPEFYLVGENWWTSWPDTLMNPAPWVKGDIFDAVMHYQWYKPARHYFHREDAELDSKLFQKSMDSVFLKYPAHTQRSMINMSASHDSPRFATSMINRNKYKYDASPRANKNYNIGPPSNNEMDFMKLFLLHQFTWVGSPQIWMGDEFAMFGSDDPDNRKPLPWNDVTFETETSSEFSNVQYEHLPKENEYQLETYKTLANVRKKYKSLIYGQYEFIHNNPKLICYTRELGNETMLVIINTSNSIQEIPHNIDLGEAQLVYSSGVKIGNKLHQNSGVLYKLR